MSVLMTKAQAAIIFSALLAVFAATPYVNKFLSKKFESNDVIINTQV